MRLLRVLPIVFLLILAAQNQAGAAPLGAEYLLGSAIPGQPAGDSPELARLDYLVRLYNGLPAVIPLGDEDLTFVLLNGSALPDTLPYPVSWGDKFEGDDMQGAELGESFILPAPAVYLMAKFGQDSYYYYVAGLTEVVILVPEGYGNDSLSHIDLFNTAPQVPEPASLLLFGTGLSVIGLGAWRRKKS